MSDEEGTSDRHGLNEDLERYIDDVKSRGEELCDETLRRLIFNRVEEKESGYDEDFADAFEIIQEDIQRSGRSNPADDSEEVYEDASSYLDPSSVASPFSAISPPTRGSLDPLSPNTNYTIHKMSRVSLCSPIASLPGYYLPNGQGVTSSTQSTILPPPQSLPVNHQPHILPPTLPNGSYHSNGVSGPSYQSPMVPPPFIPTSVPLPPTLSNGSTPIMNGMASSVTNPLFSSYVHPPSNQSYPIHPSQYSHPPLSNQSYPLHSSPYPPLHYPLPASITHHQRAAQAQGTPQEMAQFLAHQDVMTTRMISQVPPQMSLPPPHHMHYHSIQSQQSVQPSRGSISKHHHSVSLQSSSHTLHQSGSSHRSITSTDQMEAKMREKKINERMDRHRQKLKNEEEEKGKKKKSMADITVKDLLKLDRYLDKVRSIRPACEGGKYELDGKGFATVDGRKIRPRKESFISAFELPEGKSIKDYLVRINGKVGPPPLECPQRSVKYVAQIPKCAEGTSKPQLSRGHGDTEERRADPSSFGGKYLEKIQGIFHSVTGDPRRVPNKSTTGEKWEYPFKDGGAPPGMEVHPNVEGRIWNEEYDYRLVFEQLQHLTERLSGPRKETTEQTKKRSASETRTIRKDSYDSDQSDLEEVREFGNVINVYATANKFEGDADLSDCGDGRIAVGREELRKYKEKMKAKKEANKKGEKKEKEQGNEKKKIVKKELVRDLSKKVHTGFYPVLKDGNIWAKIHYYERIKEIGLPFKCDQFFSKIFVDPEFEKKEKDEKEKGEKEKKEEKEKKGGKEKKEEKEKEEEKKKKEEKEKKEEEEKKEEKEKKEDKEKKDEKGKEEDTEKKPRGPNRFALAEGSSSLERDFKTDKVLHQSNMTFYFKRKSGGYVILGSESIPALFVQSPLYNAMMGEELDTIVKITKGHEMIIFDENFFNYLLHQAYQYGNKTLYEMNHLLRTRVATTKGWGEAYQKTTIHEALVWIEFRLCNGTKKLDTLLMNIRSPLRR